MKKGWKNFWIIIIILSIIGVALCIAGVAMGAHKAFPLEIGNTSVYVGYDGISITLSGENEEELKEYLEEELEEDLEDLGIKIKENLDEHDGIDIDIDIN